MEKEPELANGEFEEVKRLIERVDIPMTGYNDMVHDDGTRWSIEEQIQGTKHQLIIAVNEWKQMGMSPDTIIRLVTPIISRQISKEEDDR